MCDLPINSLFVGGDKQAARKSLVQPHRMCDQAKVNLFEVNCEEAKELQPEKRRVVCTIWKSRAK